MCFSVDWLCPYRPCCLQCRTCVPACVPRTAPIVIFFRGSWSERRYQRLCTREPHPCVHNFGRSSFDRRANARGHRLKISAVVHPLLKMRGGVKSRHARQSRADRLLCLERVGRLITPFFHAPVSLLPSLPPSDSRFSHSSTTKIRTRLVAGRLHRGPVGARCG